MNKVTKAPRLVAKVARAQNKSQQGLTAGSGISILKTKGNTLVRRRGSNSSSGSEGAAIDVVGSDGKLNKVPKHSTWASPSAYPSALRTGATGATYSAMGSGGFETYNVSTGDEATLDNVNGLITIFSGATCKADSDGLTVTGAVEFYMNPTSGAFSMYGVHNLIISEAQLTADMAIREIDVCDSGTPKKMLVIASVPY